ncbi:MAG: YaaR family protein [Clostridiales bacterium]|nr:YaaR family protein [Clostridiales bacterium]
MKVRNVNKTEFGPADVQQTLHAGGPESAPISFKRTLTELSREQYEAHMCELIDKIDEQAEKLTKRADIGEFQKYRRLIKEFLDEVVSNSYAFSKDDAFGARGRHRFYATVKTIDGELDEMAKEVLSGQADSIDLLHRTDDIRGLILDLML